MCGKIMSSSRVALVLALLFCVASVARAACGASSANGRELDNVIHAFNAYVSKLFVGQTEAVSTVRSELAEFVNAPMTEPLILHFVGPSGTGKSYLAEIVAKSRYRPVSCKPHHEGITENSMAAAGAALGAKLGLFAGLPGALAGALGGGIAGSILGMGTNRVLEHTCLTAETLQIGRKRAASFS